MNPVETFTTLYPSLTLRDMFERYALKIWDMLFLNTNTLIIVSSPHTKRAVKETPNDKTYWVTSSSASGTETGPLFYLYIDLS